MGYACDFSSVCHGEGNDGILASLPEGVAHLSMIDVMRGVDTLGKTYPGFLWVKSISWSRERGYS